MLLFIKSVQNKTIKEINSLKNKKERDRLSLFVVEGERIVNEIPNDCKISYYVISESYYQENKNIEERLNRADIYVITNNLFNKISDTVSPQGILAVCEQFKNDMEFVFNKENAFLVVLENIMDPGNLGTIIRTADAAGADAVFLSNGCVELYNNKVIRSTMGSIFHIPVFTRVDINTLMTKLKQNNIKTISAHLKALNYPYNINLKQSCAIIIGNEANGLSQQTSNKSDELVKIPMLGKAESMNASIACSILLYEVVRQRV